MRYLTEKEREMRDETFERIAELIGGKTDGTSVFGLGINDDYFITVGKHWGTIHMTLVKDAHTGNGLDNTRIKYLTVPFGASDKVVMNRYNKLISLI